jgi:cytochrome c oxidase subunit 4
MTFEVDPRSARPLPFVVAWLVIVALAGVSLLTAFLGSGVWAPIVQFGISFIQTGIVYIVFMRLKGPPTLKWIFAVSGFFWLLFLYGISMTDYSNRRGWPAFSVSVPAFVQTPAGGQRTAPSGH